MHFFCSLKVSTLKFLVNDSANAGIKLSWELKQDYVAAYAVQGHRIRMEDRFVVNNDINNTGVSLFAIFDGHGGEVSIQLFIYHIIFHISSYTYLIIYHNLLKDIDIERTMNNLCAYSNFLT